MEQLRPRDHESSPTSRSSLTEIEEEEKDALLESVPLDAEILQKRRRKIFSPQHSRLSYIIGGLLLTNLALISALIIVFIQKMALEPSELPSWLPPERHESRMFQYLDVYGGEPSIESEKAWTKLIPSTKKLFHETIVE